MVPPDRTTPSVRPPRKRSVPIRVGLVGFGNVAAYGHVPAYANLTELFEVVALADPTPARLEMGREMLGLDPGDLRLDPAAMLARDDVEVVDICTPQHLLRAIAVPAAESGKHVLCE